MSSSDRRHIAPLLLEFFPQMEERDEKDKIVWQASSEEWAALLDQITGFSTSPNEGNGPAFDRWRQSLAQKGYPVWEHSAAQTEALAERGAFLAAKSALNEATAKERAQKLADDMKAGWALARKGQQPQRIQ